MSPEELIPSRFAEHACAVDQAWLIRDGKEFSAQTVALIEEVVCAMENGQLRASFRRGVSDWVTRQWVLRASVLAHLTSECHMVRAGELSFYDQRFDKFQGWNEQRWKESRLRVYPPTTARRGTGLPAVQTDDRLALGGISERTKPTLPLG